MRECGYVSRASSELGTLSAELGTLSADQDYCLGVLDRLA
jgi:hypothetical protein